MVPMTLISRRSFIELAIALGATSAWGRAFAKPSKIAWRERRDLYPEGVTSGDPESASVLLWTRRPPVSPGTTEKLTVEIAEDGFFERVVATTEAPISAASDWTCRVLAGGLKPRRVYWYRFTDSEGHGSRVGRTITAPADDDARPVHFAFVSCQNANQGAQNAYRRMIFEDESAAAQDRLARLRVAPWRFYLRNCLVPGGSAPGDV
jgi:alkaline phosphatase D